MKILFLANHADAGGITSYLLTLSSGLIRRGHRVFFGSAGGKLLYRFIEAGVECADLAVRTKQEFGPQVFWSALKVSAMLRNEGIDIIHANTRTTQVLASCVSGRGTPAFVSTCHGFFRPRLWRRVFPCWGSRVIAVSEEVGRHLIRDFGVRETRVRVVPNGIDAARFSVPANGSSGQLKKRLGLAAGPVVGIVARLSSVKGHAYLIDAMAQVREGFPQAQLLIAGQGDLLADLKRQAGERGIAASTVFVGDEVDAADIYRIIDVFVMPSLQEGLGLALMEAMASGCAAVASKVGGMQALIEDGVSGLLVAPGDAGAIARAVTRLLGDRDLRRACAARAREYITARYSQDEMVEKTLRVYQECLEKA